MADVEVLKSPKSLRPGMTLEDSANLRHELVRFIRGAGLSPRRLQLEGAEILALLHEPNAEAAYRQIMDVLEVMEEDQYTEVLKNALGVGLSKKPTLSERRAEWIEQSDSPISEDTIRRWERRALDALVSELVTAQEPSRLVTYDTTESILRELQEHTRLLQAILERLPDPRG